MYLSELNISSKEAIPTIKWLFNEPFKTGYLENCFPSEILLYKTPLEYYDSIIEALIHGNHKPLPFKASKMTHLIFTICNKLSLDYNGYWFNINCHDNEEGVLERIGRCQFDSKHGLFNDIFILYDLLEPNPAKEGGTSYTGIVNNTKDWMLIIERGSELIMKIYSTANFCSKLEKLKNYGKV